MNYNLISSSQTSHSAVETVLRHRDLSDDEIYKFLNPSKDNTYSPYELANIKDAAKAIVNALSNQEDIYIQVDSDCDGYTSSALLINYLYGIAPATVLNHVTYGLHSSKQHGIDMSSIKEKTKLVIIPDASSNEVKPHTLLHDRGIEVVVLDHHEFCLDDDPAIIVNNQFGDYPNRALSGVGIVYKLCQLIDEFLPIDERKADLELDLVAVGMIADMMDLRSAETKYLITEGLNNITNPFISAMRKKNEFVMKGIMSPFTVSFYIAPFVNAVTR
ncbi:MAG: DHH family phosphoesterase, partial [Clostridiales bacterium]